MQKVNSLNCFDFFFYHLPLLPHFMIKGYKTYIVFGGPLSLTNEYCIVFYNFVADGVEVSDIIFMSMKYFVLCSEVSSPV